MMEEYGRCTKLTLELEPPGERVLLHVCCAPCSGAIVEAMDGQGIHPTIFWSNSNILSAAENDKRLSCLQAYARKFGVPVVVDEYDHKEWLAFVREQLAGWDKGTERGKGLRPEDCRERGPRCLSCFKFRLLRAARYAVSHGFDCLTTSLASSRWKSLGQVDDAGAWACGQANSEELSEQGAGGHPESSAGILTWWPQNWRKGGLQPRRGEIIREQDFYNQSFCGCEFSLPDKGEAAG